MDADLTAMSFVCYRGAMTSQAPSRSGLRFHLTILPGNHHSCFWVLSSILPVASSEMALLIKTNWAKQCPTTLATPLPTMRHSNRTSTSLFKSFSIQLYLYHFGRY